MLKNIFTSYLYEKKLDINLKDLVKKIVKDGQVVLHEQELTQQELTQVCEKMGYHPY